MRGSAGLSLGSDVVKQFLPRSSRDCNPAYESIDMLEGILIVEYTNDVAVVVLNKTEEELRTVAEMAHRRILNYRRLSRKSHMCIWC